MDKDLLLAQKLIYEPSGLVIKDFRLETESTEYCAAEFEMNDRCIKYRMGKITPTKIGQFVTLWKRIDKGPITPYEVEDLFDLFVISAHNTTHFGQFIFPKAVLCEKGVLSKNKEGGKRAMRIYPPWDKADNPQAKKTQAWQLPYFFEINQNFSLDFAHFQRLFNA